MRHGLPALVIVVIVLWALVELAAAPAAAQPETPQVVASFSILADIASQVAGGAAQVTSLMPLGANPHTYTPSAQDVARLSDADAILIAGAGFEESLLPVLEEAAGNRVTVVSQCVLIRPVETGQMQASAGDLAPSAPETTPPSDDWADRCGAHNRALEEAFGEHARVEGATLGPLYALRCGGHADNDASADHAREASACDPHVWTDPANAALWALMIRDTLSALDPASAELYAANTRAYLGELAALDQALRGVIDSIPAARRTLVTNHAALTYFAARYGLTLAGVVIPGGSTTSEPSVRDVLALVDTIRAQGIGAIFTETTASDATAAEIAAEAGIPLVPLYTGSLSQPGEGAETYLDYMRYNANAIADALR